MAFLNEELSKLIHQLREIETSIIKLTGDSIDTVIDTDGMPFMLSKAQHELRERADIHLSYAEQQSAILNAIPAQITLIDGEGYLLEVNDAWRDFAIRNGNSDPLFGVGQNYLKACYAVSGEETGLASAAAKGIRSVLLGEQPNFTMEYPCHSPWKQQWFKLMVTSLSSNDRNGAVVMHLDITERKLADVEMQRALSVFKSSNDGILITDANLIALDVNPAYSIIRGHAKEDVLGQKIRLINFKLQSDGLEEITKRLLKTKGFWRGEVRNHRKSGEVYIESVSISHVYDDQGKLLNYIAIFSDITESKQHEVRLDYVAHHDHLTGLPNRRLLTDRLEQAVLMAKRDDKLLALCYIDLDNFKPINDKYGHTTGDNLLIEISRRMKLLLRESDTVSRIGGDEFILLLRNLKNEEELHELLRRLMFEIKKMVPIDEHEVHVTASIGIVLFPYDNVDADTLLRHADQAMYLAKEGGRNQYYIYDHELAKETENRNNLLDEIKKSLLAKEFILFYQPKVNLISGTVIGFEALVRWQHPIKGLLSPAEFLPVIIDSNIEILFGEYVMRCAIEQLNYWQIRGHNIKVSVNVSPNELRQDNLIEKINNELRRFPILKAQQLEIEVLETAAVYDLTQVISTLNQCRDAGIKISLDDFGTGYSSLTICRQLPVDILKIDQSFVRKMLTDQNDKSIVESVISMARALGRDVIAEGVETKSHASQLIEIGCEYGQGYGIAKPMPASEVLDWLSRPIFVWEK